MADYSTQPQPDQEYFNSADGQTYTLKYTEPTGKGFVMMNTLTQEEVMLPEEAINEAQGLTPIMKSTTKQVISNDIDTIVNGDESHADTKVVVEKVQEHLMDEIDIEIAEMERAEQGIEGDIEEVINDAQLFNELSTEAPIDGSVEVIKDIRIPNGAATETIDNTQHLMPYEDAPDASLENKDNTLPILASTQLPIPVVSKHIPWKDYRKKITTHGQIAVAQRKLNHLKKVSLTPVDTDLSYSPDNRDVDASGHSKVNNIPIAAPSAEKNMTIGMTEFPKDQKRDDSVGLDTGKGYNIPIKRMDENQVANREKFDNEQRQYMYHMTIRQYRELLGGTNNKEVNAIEKGKGLQQARQPVKPDKNLQYDIEKEAIAQEVGLISFAEIELDPEKKNPDLTIPADIPVQHKTIQKAPPLKEYVEPGVIQPASKEVELFLTSFSQHYQRLQELKSELTAELAPYQEEIAGIQGQRMPEISREESLLKDALEMAYKAISATEDSLVHYQDELWAAVSRTKTLRSTVTVAQVIAEAKMIDQHLADQIEKLSETVGVKGESKVRERRLYEYPPSKSHEKRMKPLESSLYTVAISSLLKDLTELIQGFVFLNSEIKEALSILG